MKKLFLIIPLLAIILVSVVGVIAFDKYAAKWSIRGMFDGGDIEEYFELLEEDSEETWAKGRFSANLNLQRANPDPEDENLYWDAVGAGEFNGWIMVNDWSKEWFSVNWQAKGNKYGFDEVYDDEEMTIIYAFARVNRNRDVWYGVPVMITLMKDTGEFIIESTDMCENDDAECVEYPGFTFSSNIDNVGNYLER